MNSAAAIAFGRPTSFCLYIYALEWVIAELEQDGPKEELAIEVGDVDSVHINDMDVCKPQQG